MDRNERKRTIFVGRVLVTNLHCCFPGQFWCFAYLHWWNLEKKPRGCTMTFFCYLNRQVLNIIWVLDSVVFREKPQYETGLTNLHRCLFCSKVTIKLLFYLLVFTVFNVVERLYISSEVVCDGTRSCTGDHFRFFF